MAWPADPTIPSDLLFSGLKVIDAGSWVAGPAAATILADFGADVIKIEQPGAGDGYRALHAGPRSPEADIDYMWLADNRNKRGIVLNLATSEAKAVLHELVRECDVYLTNQPIGQRRRFGLMYEDLAPLNPRMIYASLTAFGETGDEAEYEGFDANAYWARSGLMEDVRVPGAAPSWSAPGQGDHPTAVATYAAIVSGLLYRERTGKGTRVHTSLLANGIWANLCLAMGALAGADFARRRGPLVLPPFRLPYETADGRLLQLSMLRTDEMFVRLLVELGPPPLLEDPRFTTAEARAAHATELVEELAARLRRHTAADWFARLRPLGLPIDVITRTEDIGNDAQMRAIGALVPPSDPTVPVPLVVNHPINVDGAARVGPRWAPAQGEHTREVLAAMGKTPEEIDDFVARGVV
jgi:formyl-CoA transferase